MARLILIEGEPGTGKSTSMMNLDPLATVILKPNGKEIPFAGAARKFSVKRGNVAEIRTFQLVGGSLNVINGNPNIKNVVIEDLTHFFSKKVIDDRNITGYSKWSELAAEIKINIIDKEFELRPDLNVIVIAHVAAVVDALGKQTIGIQTPGKLLDNIVKIPSYFTYIFHTFVDKDEKGATRYRFLTNVDGIREAKSPQDMFPKYIPNDLKFVIDSIDDYQNSEGIQQYGMSLAKRESLLNAQRTASPIIFLGTEEERAAKAVIAPEGKQVEAKDIPTA